MVNVAEPPGDKLAEDGFALSVKSAELTPAVTVSPVDPEIEPDLAVICVVPAATPVAVPPLTMVAAPVLLEFHVTEALMS